MVTVRSPGPAPADQARANNSRLTRSSWRTWPHRKLRRKVPRVDGALTTQPMALAVPPVRSTSASSMQSPPASADATRVSILSPVFARPGKHCRGQTALPDVPAIQVPGQGDRKDQPRIGHQAVVVEGDIGSGLGRCVVAFIGAPVSGRFCLSKTIIPEAQEHFLTPLARRDTHPFGGLGLSRSSRLNYPRLHGGRLCTAWDLC